LEGVIQEGRKLGKEGVAPKKNKKKCLTPVEGKTPIHSIPGRKKEILSIERQRCKEKKKTNKQRSYRVRKERAVVNTNWGAKRAILGNEKKGESGSRGRRKGREVALLCWGKKRKCGL